VLALTEAARQVARFRVLRNFPEESSAQAELVRALQQCAASTEHAAAITDLALERCRFSPVPAEIRELGAETAERFRAPAPEPCEKCVDGWITGQYLVTSTPDRARKATVEPINSSQLEKMRDKLSVGRQMVYEGVRTCSCAAGKHQDLLNASYALYTTTKGQRSHKAGAMPKMQPGDMPRQARNEQLETVR
jgi:hypothetical protein